MNELEMGTWYTIEATATKRKDWHTVTWERAVNLPRKAMYIGKRTVFDGRIVRGGDTDPDGFVQERIHRVYLFVLNDRHNPIYVFPNDVIMKADADA